MTRFAADETQQRSHNTSERWCLRRTDLFVQ